MSTKTTDTNTPSGPYTVEEAPLEYSATHRWRVTGPGFRSDAFDRSEAAYALCSQLNAAYHAGQKSMVKGEVVAFMTEADAMSIAHEWGSEMGHVKEFMLWARTRINAFFYSAPPTDNTEKK